MKTDVAPSAGPERAAQAPAEQKNGSATEAEAIRARADLKEEIDLTKRAEIEGQGEAKKYAENFSKSADFIPLCTILELRKREAPGSEFDFEAWLTLPDFKELADLFETNPLFPSGISGKKAFIAGLRNYDPKLGQQTDEFKKSYDSLAKIVASIREHLNKTDKYQEEANKQIEKKALPDFLGDGIKNFKANYRRASGGEKAMMLGALGIAAWLLNKYKDNPVGLGINLKWSQVFWGIVGLYGVNYLSGKVTKDDKTLLQRVDISRGIDDFPDNPLKAYAEKHEFGETEAKFRTYKLLLNQDVKQLFELYEEASDNRQTSIDPKKLGFHKNEIDGKEAFTIIDKFVKDAAVNEFVRGRLKEGPTERLTEDQKNHCMQPNIARKLFKEAYFAEEGTFRNVEQTLMQAVLNEYNSEQAFGKQNLLASDWKSWEEQIKDGKDKRLWQKYYEKIKSGLKWTYKQAKKYGGIATHKTIEVGKEVLNFSKDHIGWPILTHFRRYVSQPTVEFLENSWGKLQAKDLKEVLPESFNVSVTSPEIEVKPGMANILGYPLVPFMVMLRKEDSEEVAIIDGIEFLLKDKQKAENVVKADQLKSKITEKVKKIFTETPKHKALEGKDIEWDATEKMWLVKGIKSKGKHAELGLDEEEMPLAFTIDPDGKTIKFSVGKKGITDFDELDEMYEEAKIQEEVWQSPSKPEIRKYIKGLPVTEIEVGKDAAGKTTIKARLAGLPFEATFKGDTLSAGLEFKDTKGNSLSDLDQLVIDRKQRGADFTRAVADKIWEEPYYKEPFLVLQNQIENTPEGVLSRLEEFAKERAWIFPTNVRGLLNGKILQRQWGYTLQFKMLETLELFEDDLQGKKIADIPGAYKTYIEGTHNNLATLSQYIAGLTENQKAQQFEGLLRGPGNMATGQPRGLERLHYTGAVYRKHFEKYQKMIAEKRYDYSGLEKLDASASIWGKDFEASRDFYDIYVILLRVWSHSTRHLRHKNTSTPPLGKNFDDDEMYLKHVIDKVSEKLEKAMRDGTIKKANLPPSESEVDLEKWIQ